MKHENMKHEKGLFMFSCPHVSLLCFSNTETIVFTIMSASKLNGQPIGRVASVVALSVVGISATSNRSLSRLATVKLTPSRQTDPFGATNFINCIGGST